MSTCATIIEKVLIMWIAIQSILNYNPNAFTFRKAFPDIALASCIADTLGKRIDDETSEEELAGITGGLSIISYSDENGNIHDCADLTGIRYLKGLTEFDCYKNDVVEIPAEIKELKDLKVLNLTKAYSLTTIPPEIGELRDLEVLRLSLTSLEKLPKEIGNLSSLVFLDASATPINELPEEIGKLKNLESLDIHASGVKTLPDSICDLENLKYLDLSHLELEKLPADFGNLTKLEELNLFNCNLKILPRSMERLTSLRSINLYDNFELSESYKEFLPKKLWEGKNF